MISEDKFKKLVKSIKEFPEMLDVRPVVVDEEFMILGGNMRLKALQEAGVEEVEVTQVTGWTDKQKKEFIIKDNIGYGNWDWDALANWWNVEELDDWGLDLPDEWSVEEKEGLTEDDAVPEVPEEPTAKLGDIYQLGEHRVMCGDSTKIEDVERLMDGKKADMVFTDPPYGMNLEVKMSERVQPKGDWKNKPKQYDKVIGDDEEFDPRTYLDYFENVKEQFWWGADYYADKLPKGGSFIVWDKRDDMKVEYSTSEFELCWSKQKHLRRIIRVKWFGLIGTESQDVRKRVHPTQKPIQVCERIMMEHASDDDIVADLFLGSGSTLIAAEKTGRICYGMELDPKYVDVIVKRWEDYTGKKAILLN